MKHLLPLLLFTSCAIPVSVRNTPERPVPTAPMGELVVREQGEGGPVVAAIVQVNPSLGEVPSKEEYEDGPGFWGTAVTALTQAGAGNYLGAAATALAAITGGAAVHQRRRRKQEGDAHKKREVLLAEMDPETATKIVRVDQEA